jgi:hypothetical protein
MTKNRCVELLSKIIADGTISLQEYDEDRQKERFQEKIDALRYAKRAVEEE